MHQSDTEGRYETDWPEQLNWDLIRIAIFSQLLSFRTMLFIFHVQVLEDKNSKWCILKQHLLNNLGFLNFFASEQTRCVGYIFSNFNTLKCVKDFSTYFMNDICCSLHTLEFSLFSSFLVLLDNLLMHFFKELALCPLLEISDFFKFNPVLKTEEFALNLSSIRLFAMSMS